MLSELKDLFAVWIGAVAAAIDAIVTRIVPQRRVLLVEGERGHFTARIISASKGAVLPQLSLRLHNGRLEPAFRPAMAGGAARQPYRRDDAIGPAVVPHRRFSKGRGRFPRQHGPCPDGSPDAVVARRCGFGMTAPLASAPRTPLLLPLNTSPIRPPINASLTASRQCPAHDSGSVWIATPSL